MSENGWWWQNKDAPHEGIAAALTAIAANQGWQNRELLDFMRLYDGAEHTGSDGEYYRRNASRRYMPFNTIRSAINTCTAKIGKNKIKATVLTYDGDFKLGRRAKKMDKFLVGQFYKTQLYKQSPMIFRDGSIVGTGCLKVSSNKVEKEIVADRILRGELKIDDADGMHGRPRNIFHIRPYAREVAQHLWPKFKQQIADAPSLAELKADEGAASTIPYTPLSKQVMVREAWHLPSSKGAHDGRHVICLHNVTLEQDEWTRPRFPFAFFHWSPPIRGFWGTGIAEEMQDGQNEIDFTAERIHQSMKFAVPTGFYDTNTDFNPSEMTNEISQWHGFDSTKGVAPSVQVLAGSGPENMQYLETMIRHNYEFQGTSQLSAQSQKPGGLDSGAALEQFNDIESERFVLPGQQFEQFFMEASQLYIDEARAIAAANDGKFETTVTGKKYGRKFIETIDWEKDADMEDDEYTLQIFPQSSLPNTPAGRRQELENRIKMGAISIDDALEQLDLPDNERSNSVLLAARYDIEETIERFLDADIDGKDDAKVDNLQERLDVEIYQPYEPYQDPVIGLRLFKLAYLNAKRSGYPEERLELLRRWMSEAQIQSDKLNAAPASASPDQGQGAPMVSNTMVAPQPGQPAPTQGQPQPQPS